MQAQARDHGGNIDGARAEFGGAPETWIDLSTGINRVSYPLPAFSPEASQALPTRAALDGLIAAAAQAYACSSPILPLAGAQAAIQILPRLLQRGSARVLSPTYNEHAACLLAAGWAVTECPALRDLAGADLAVVVNPNNPDGKTYSRSELTSLAQEVGGLIVDESFGDARPDLSLAPMLDSLDNVYVLRSFGKFYGLAGLRLGFVCSGAKNISQLSEFAGPWPVSGFAIEAGRAALADREWAQTTVARLTSDCQKMDRLAAQAGWTLVGGTELFRLYETGDASAAQALLAQHQIWSRIFPWSSSLIRLGLPGSDAEWQRVAEALT